MCAYLRATEPSTPNVEATALHSPSIASLTIFSPSKYSGFLAKLAPRGMLDALINGEDGHIAGAGEASVIEQTLKVREHANVAIG